MSEKNKYDYFTNTTHIKKFKESLEVTLPI